MILTNLSCRYILASSEHLTDVANAPDSYSKIKVEVTKNCCETFTEEIEVHTSGTWKILLPVSSTLKVSSATFRSILTGLEFTISLLDNGSPRAITSLSDFDTITSLFNTTLGSSIVGTKSSAENTYSYILSSLPENIVPVSIEYSYEGAETKDFFGYQYSDKNTIFSASGVLISPSLLGVDSFEDGVYTIVVTPYTFSGTRMGESSCIFLDCTTKCQVAEKVQTLKTDQEKINLLMLHYGLSLGTNCACECENLCSLFEQVQSILDNSVTTCNCG